MSLARVPGSQELSQQICLKLAMHQVARGPACQAARSPPSSSRSSPSVISSIRQCPTKTGPVARYDNVPSLFNSVQTLKTPFGQNVNPDDMRRQDHAAHAARAATAETVQCQGMVGEQPAVQIPILYVICTSTNGPYPTGKSQDDHCRQYL